MFVARYKAPKQFKRVANYDKSYVTPANQKRKKCWSATVGVYIPLIIGGLLEIGGYLARIASANNAHGKKPNVAQVMLIIVAPGMVCGTLHMRLCDGSRLLNYLPTSRVRFLIRNSLMLKLFVASDVASFVLQGVNAGFTSQAYGEAVNRIVVFSALLVQLLSMGLFLRIQVNLLIRHSKHSADNYCNTTDKRWQALNYCMSGSSAFIMIRTIVRTIESVDSWYVYISSNKALLFVFDGLVMLISMVFVAAPFLFVHPWTLYVWHCSYAKESAPGKHTVNKLENGYVGEML